MTGKKPDPVELDYQNLFRTEVGERVLRDLMLKSCIWSTTIVPGDALSMAFNEGRRAVVLDILEMARKKFDRPTEYADEATEAEMDYTAKEHGHG